MHSGMEHLRQLPLTEKLRVIEDLWDDIAASGERFPLPAWHRAEAERRAAELEADPSIALTRDELWHQVDATNGRQA